MMNGQMPDALMNDFTVTSVMDKMETIKQEIEECNENPTDENIKKRDELVWAQFMAGLKLCSGNLYF